MNEDIILQMVEPYVKDGTITYNQFDFLFNILSLKEQYDVVELLYKKGIDLVDKQIDEDSIILDIGENENDEEGEVLEILYDESIFKDSSDYQSEYLVTNKVVKQSNEILCALIQQGDRQAEQDLCVKNRRLVGKYVIGYQKKYGNRLEYEDLMQVGFMGLIKAAKRFDIKKGTAFSTYAVFWIKQSISREIIDNGFAIRIPVHMMERINKVQAVDFELRLEDEEMVLEERILHISDRLGLNEEQVIECFVLKNNVLRYASLDTPVGENEDTLLMDLIPDDEVVSTEDIVCLHVLKDDLTELLSSLTEREAQIIKLRFGIEDNKPRTLEEIGKMYGVTRERIRQIEAKALRKMKRPSKSKKIRGYI